MGYPLWGTIILVLDIIAILGVIQSTMTSGKKLLWILIILLLPFIGMLLWFLIGNK